jgi:hypothetical protein
METHGSHRELIISEPAEKYIKWDKHTGMQSLFFLKMEGRRLFIKKRMQLKRYIIRPRWINIKDILITQTTLKHQRYNKNLLYLLIISYA